MAKSIEVRNRIEVVKRLRKLKEHFKGPEGIEILGEGRATHFYRHFDSLMNYLLLTCFDILGQTNDFVDFGKWLSAKGKEIERSEIIKAFNKDSSPVETAKYIFSEYNKRYSVRTSFYNFIDSIIPNERKQELLESIIIRVNDDAGNDLGMIHEEKTKKEFLFKARNSFTHKGISIGSPTGGLWDHDEGIVFHGKRQWFPIFIHEEK